MDRFIGASKVVIARKWNSPHITATITNEEISLTMSLADFVFALAEEVGSPTFIITKKGLKEAILSAGAKVEAEMKDASKFVV